MAELSHRDLVVEMPNPPGAGIKQTPQHDLALASQAKAWAHTLTWMPALRESEYFAKRVKAAGRRLESILAKAEVLPAEDSSLPEDLQWLRDNGRLLQLAQKAALESVKDLSRSPHVRTPDKVAMPRVLAVAANFLESNSFLYSDHDFAVYVENFHQVVPLNMRELGMIPPCLQLVLLEQILLRGEKALARPAEPQNIGALFNSLRETTETPWRELLEPLIVFERVLAADPAAAYGRSDFQSRNLYRNTVAHFAEHADLSELEIAQLALKLAREAQRHHERDPRLTWRKSHIGYYLIGEGADKLRHEASVRLPIGERIEAFLHRHPEEFYLGGIELLTMIIVIAIMTPVFNGFNTFLGRILAILLLLLPASQSAVEVMNYLTTTLLHPRILPKLDFSKGVPSDCVSMVVVPTLLLSEKQVRKLVNDLEVRYLGNASPNLHFALLTDMPDSEETPSEENPLVDLCTELIQELNRKYPEENGRFFLFHRHRVYNPREGVWMGWERKRGKLLDFNRLIKGEYDSFPVKIGELDLLKQVRFVITLDTDTELPRGTAQRLVGAITHPLSQAIIDPRRNVVTLGYGILQPRVGISVQSAAQSRLASIYSGQTGFDIYTRAVSDVYQDLCGEGIFTGKGIYEVDTLHQVLEHRFPRNALLSHDLIEGAYARAGLVSDVELIDDYPSHYSAYNRRKHRWLRGDWQIVPWLFGRVSDETAHKVPNPISFLSRWKILDNLRRSLVEAGTFLLFLLGWTVLPGKPIYWTLVTIAILFLPPFVQFAFTAVRAILSRRVAAIGDAFVGLGTSLVGAFLTLTFLAYQTLLSIDAVLRTQYRRIISRERLLEWETAAEAELGARKMTPVDLLLTWSPVLSIAVGAMVYFAQRRAFNVAMPILVLWACAKPVSYWLNRPPRPVRKEATRQDERFLRRCALHTWRYFAEFSNEEHNWLIPDNVEPERDRVAARLSPTNLGFLLNARQLATEFGYVTVPEFSRQTVRTMDTVARLPKQRGHLYNWYDTRTLEALRPRFLSTVDSGNLAASLITLESGCREMLRKPLLRPSLFNGYADHLCALAEVKVLSKRSASAFEKDPGKTWLDRLLTAAVDLPTLDEHLAHADDARWYLAQTSNLIAQVRDSVTGYLPWLLPEFELLRRNTALTIDSNPEAFTLEQLPSCIDQLQRTLRAAYSNPSPESPLIERLLSLLPVAGSNCLRLTRELQELAARCERMVREMDFRFLLDRRRKLLSIGCDAEANKVHAACYDLLASEARIAAFVAIAKDDIPQESWFQMGRAHVVDRGLALLVSWTGTMFEYLMPGLWMRSYPDTMLQRSKENAVVIQQAYAASRRIPWGISESAYAKLDDHGNWGYRAFGVPQLAIQQDESRLVVAPYATVLALDTNPGAAIRQMRWMDRKGWLSTYGFVESADFTPDVRRSRRQRYELVREWMVHHQGMSLLAIGNFLFHNVVQNWFHQDARVQATELLLQERPVRRVPKSARKMRRSRKQTASSSRSHNGKDKVKTAA